LKNYCYPPSKPTPTTTEKTTPEATTMINGAFCPYNVEEIHTVEQYLRAVDKAYKELWDSDKSIGASENSPKLWFRGQKSVDYPLLPAIARSQNRIDDENILLAKFQAMADPYLSDMPSYTLSSLRQLYWRTLFLMQHYGIPTRLLDWTEDALVALLFAIDSNINDAEAEKNPVVWCLNPLKSNKIFAFADGSVIPNVKEKAVYEHFGPIKTNCENKSPCAVYADLQISKIINEKNTFTVFPYCQDLIAMDKLPSSETFLSKLIIARDCREYISAQLRKYGLKKEEFKPELISIAQKIK